MTESLATETLLRRRAALCMSCLGARAAFSERIPGQCLDETLKPPAALQAQFLHDVHKKLCGRQAHTFLEVGCGPLCLFLTAEMVLSFL